jgi:FtsH-binding integral membrane protein
MKRLVVLNPIVMIVLMLAELGLVFYASARLRTLTPASAAAIFILYSLLTGVTLIVIFFVYRMPSIVQAFGAAAAMFAAMSVYGRVTRRSLTGWGQFLIMGVIGLIVASVINLFLRSSALEMAVASIGVFIFAGLTAYKTQSLKQLAHAGGAQVGTLAIYGALSLYITFINLFLSLLRLFGNRR